MVQRGIDDPYLKERTETEKCSLLCNFFLMRYNEGRRGKGAYGIGASVRKMFQIGFQSVTFCDHPMATAARTACRRSTDELRAMQRAGEGNDKLPIFWDMLAWIRDQHWANKTWLSQDIDDRMAAMAALLAYDLANRGGEATTVGGIQTENHSIFCEQCVFRVEDPIEVRGVMRYSFKAGTDDFKQYAKLDNVVSCDIGVASHKSGVVHAVKVIARRTERESDVLDNFYEWCSNSGALAEEPVFSRRVNTGKAITYKKLTPKMLATVIKGAAVAMGMDPREYANHSLRKGAVTQMNAYGCSREETKARGNYSKESILVDTVYNHNNTGRGPTAASSSANGRDITREDVYKQSKSARLG